MCTHGMVCFTNLLLLMWPCVPVPPALATGDSWGALLNMQQHLPAPWILLKIVPRLCSRMPTIESCCFIPVKTFSF